MTALEQRGFVGATERMFKSRIREWKLDSKTIREADWKYMFQVCTRRRKSSTPKETIFEIRPAIRRPTRVTKNYRDIMRYMRRIKVTEDHWLAEPFDSADFVHIRPMTPVSSPTMHTPEAASSMGQIDDTGTNGIQSSSASPFNAPGMPSTLLERGSDKMARQTFWSIPHNSADESNLYRSIAGAPTLLYPQTYPSDGDSLLSDHISRIDEMDADHNDDDSMTEPTHQSVHASRAFSTVQSYTPDEDAELAFSWASRYFLACIFTNQMNTVQAEACMKDATRIFGLMLESECRSPCSVDDYRPSHRSRFVLSGLSLMYTVLHAHGRGDMLEKFLENSRRTIAIFFKMEDHMLSVAYSYLLADVREDSVDLEYWEKRLREAYDRISMLWDRQSPNAIVVHYYWSWHLLKCRRYEETIQQLTSCLQNAERVFGKCHIITVNCLTTIARAYSEQMQCDTAKTLLEDAIQRSQHALGSMEHPFRFKLIERLGMLHQQTGNLDLAEANFREVVRGRVTCLGFRHSHTSHAEFKLHEIMSQQGKHTERSQSIAQLEHEYATQHENNWGNADNEHDQPLYRRWCEEPNRQYPFVQPPLPVDRLVHFH